jgi:hypothetical protein
MTDIFHSIAHRWSRSFDCDAVVVIRHFVLCTGICGEEKDSCRSDRGEKSPEDCGTETCVNSFAHTLPTDASSSIHLLVRNL